MEKDLHKRLEEAAEKITHCEFCRYRCDDMSCKELCADTIMTIRGIELGYKEAIEVAKKWLLGKIRIEIDADGTMRETDGKIFYRQLVSDFETDMNKLWEG